MKLPELAPKTFKVPFGGEELQFRKFRVKDKELLRVVANKVKDEKIDEVTHSLMILAHFMEGYDESNAELVVYLSNISWDNISDINESIGDVMERIGMTTSEKKAPGAKKSSATKKTPKTSKK